MIIGIGVLVACFSFMGTIWFSTKVADLHYKIKDSEQPLYLIYGGMFVSIWGAVMAALLDYLSLI